MDRTRSGRWAYMAHPSFNPPNNNCPECPEASRTYFVGGRTIIEDGVRVTLYTWQCQNRHRWVVTESSSERQT